MKKNVLLSFAAVLFTFLVLESALRLLTPDLPPLDEGPSRVLFPERIWTEYHPQLGWYHQKNKHAVLRIRDYDIDIHTNSEGFRGEREYKKEKPASRTRVAIVGDSFTFGFGVEDDETFCSLMERDMADLEVLNLGVPGYGIDQMLMSYRTLARAYHPDYVVIAIFSSVFTRATRAFAPTAHGKPYFYLSSEGKLVLKNVPVPPPEETPSNRYPEVIQRSPVETILIRSEVYRMVKTRALLLGQKLGWVDPDTTTEWTLGKAILRNLIDEIRRDGATPILAILPRDRWVTKEHGDPLYLSLLRFAKQEKVDLVDLLPSFVRAVRASKLTDYYIDGDWHWTAKGHALAADLLVDYLEKESLKSRKAS